MQIDIIAPGFKIPSKDYQSTLKLLQSLSMDYRVRSPLFEKGHLCAASRPKRWADLKSALTSKKTSKDTIKSIENTIIWCLRGGYGCLHLLPELKKLKASSNYKLLIGFSDITILHYFLNQVWRWPSLHYQHLNSYTLKYDFKQAQKQIQKDLQALKHQPTYEHRNLKPLNSAAQKIKSLKAPIVGGNLITLASLIGSGLPLPQNQFLFLEEIEEPAYKVDRALSQLEQTAWLKNLKGILLGSFTHSNSKQEKLVHQQIKSFFKDSKTPVFKGLKCGHIKNQKPLFLSTPSKVYKKDNKFILENSGLDTKWWPEGRF